MQIPKLLGHALFVCLAFTTSLLYAQPKTFSQQVTGAAIFRHPIVPVGEIRPDEVESAELFFILQSLQNDEEHVVLDGLESFISQHTNSAWVPSIQTYLGEYYRERGRFSLALIHWEEAWTATQNLTDPNGKHIADFAFSEVASN